MMIVGLTGGIGSGKTTVANYFKKLGVPIYVADVEAKLIMGRSKVVRRELVALFGEKVYHENILDRKLIAEAIFNDRDLLAKMNAIVHPKVAAHFKKWCKKQDAPYAIKEAAIIFEHDMQHQYDQIITVVAEKEARIERVLSRDDRSRASIEKIMENQWSDKDKADKSDFIIENHDLDSTEKQVKNIHAKLLRNAHKYI